MQELQITSYKLRIMLIGLTQQASKFVIASPLGRGNLLVECCRFVGSTRRFLRRSVPRNDRLGTLLNKADKHITNYDDRFESAKLDWFSFEPM